MRATSLRDIMLADSLSKFPNEISVISPVNDSLVAEVLKKIGYDVKQDWEYVPSKHRDLRNKIAIGFMVVGEYSRDFKYRKFIDTTDRIVLAGMLDPSLGREMATMQGRKNIYRNDDDQWNDGSRAKKDDPRYYSEEELLEFGFTTGGGEEGDDFGGEYVENDWEETLRVIKQLESIRDIVRGGI